MKGTVSTNALHFKIGSFEWLNFFGLPIGLIAFSLVEVFFYLQDVNSNKADIFFSGFLFQLIIGIAGYYIQLKRLKFKTFLLNDSLTDFKSSVKNLLKEDDWEIEYDNSKYLQASYRSSLFNFDQLTLKYTENAVLWTIVHNPQSRNSIAAIITLNRDGNKMIRKIKALAYKTLPEMPRNDS